MDEQFDVMQEKPMSVLHDLADHYFRRMSSACLARGTRWGRPLTLPCWVRFIFCAGIDHSSASKSISAHSICRMLPGR